MVSKAILLRCRPDPILYLVEATRDSYMAYVRVPTWKRVTELRLKRMDRICAESPQVLEWAVKNSLSLPTFEVSAMGRGYLAR